VIRLLEAQPEIDLVLLDLHMPGNHGLAGLAAIRAQFPAVAVVLVSANEDPQVIRRALDHGAAGYIPKSAGLDEMREAIHAVLACEQWLPPALRGPVERAGSLPGDADLAARLASLTPQQFRVLSLVAEGLLNKQIADRLDVQERTVKAHLSAIFEKLWRAQPHPCGRGAARTGDRRPGSPVPRLRPGRLRPANNPRTACGRSGTA